MAKRHFSDSLSEQFELAFRDVKRYSNSAIG